MGPVLSIDSRSIIAPGTSGSPIVNIDGQATGVIVLSCGASVAANPVLTERLPRWLLRSGAPVTHNLGLIDDM
jgi:hypothetical protein